MPRAARKTSKPGPAAVLDGPDPHLHAGKCTICKHAQRAEIERAFVDWSSPLEITKSFGLASRSTIYRHARARGLFEIRRRNLHYGLSRIAERAADVNPSAANVIAAFIAMAKINARGEWSTERRFEANETIERAHWELLSAAARENELEDTLAGDLAPVQEEQQSLREARARLIAAKKAAEKAAKEAEVAKEAERKKLAEKQAAEKAKATEQKQEQEKQEATKPARAPEPDNLDPSGRPSTPAQVKIQPKPEPERPHPIPRPPENAPPLEASGPPQVAGLPWPKEKILFARRRGRRPVVP